MTDVATSEREEGTAASPQPPGASPLRLEARRVTRGVDEKVLLEPTSLRIEPGELVALVGESGAGKTTLIRTLAGVDAPTAGTVLVNGEPVAGRRTEIGYVPQQEIVHGLLSIDEALDFSARLRLPPGTTHAERRATIDRVLAEVSLTDHRHTRIANLSGGERKRVAVAAELLTRPRMLFLDEPTANLDPSLEARMMELFRRLAEPGSRAVVMATHATRRLDVFDKIAVIARGGRLAFFGPPAEALTHFGIADYDEVYEALEVGADRAGGGANGSGRTAPEGRGAPSATSPTTAGPAPAAPSPGPGAPSPAPGTPRRTGSPRRRPGLVAQAVTLIERYALLLTRDRRNLVILLGQAPLIGFAIAIQFEPDVFGGGDPRDPGRPLDGANLIFLVANAAVWLGLIDGSREIIKERSIALREAAIGVRSGAYVASKAVVLFGLAAVQTAVMATVVFATCPLGASAGDWAAVIGLLVLTSLVAVGMGLLISALVSSEDQATSAIPMAVLPQLLFAGAIVPLDRMAKPIDSLAAAVFSRWSFEAVGGAADMDTRLAGDAAAARVTGYGETFFELAPTAGAAILGLFLLGFFAVLLVVVSLRRG